VFRCRICGIIFRMDFTVYNNPKFNPKTGFTNAQFKKLDGLYLRAAAEKLFNYRSVDVDFDEGVASYAYHMSESRPPVLQFIIRKVGPKTMMYEVWKGPKGRIAKSGVFEKAYQKLEDEISELL